MPEAAKVDVEAEKSRIIEYHGLIAGNKKARSCAECGFGALL